MRIVAISIAVLLGACTPEPSPSPDIAEQGGAVIQCALGGEAEFSSECRLVEEVSGIDPVFIMRHPDGGFRRLAVDESPAGFIAINGAAASASERDGDWVVLMIDADRYRWKEPLGE